VARRVHSSHRPLDPLPLALPSQRHSTALPSPKRYDKRYEAEDPRRTSENPQNANFVEFYEREVRRIPIPRTWVNKGLLVCLRAIP
jgi:hypothetical protein